MSTLPRELLSRAEKSNVNLGQGGTGPSPRLPGLKTVKLQKALSTSGPRFPHLSNKPPRMEVLQKYRTQMQNNLVVESRLPRQAPLAMGHEVLPSPSLIFPPLK